MNLHPTRARLALLSAAALGVVLLTPQPASALPVEGSVTAGVTLPYSGNCDIVGDDDADTRTFTSSGSGLTTATAQYEGTESGNPVNLSFRGTGTSTTKASATAKKGSLKRIRLKARHQASIRNFGTWDCVAVVTVDSQTGTAFVIRKKAVGKVKLSWTRGAEGSIAAINVVGPGGKTVSSFTPATATGTKKIKVKRGSYYLFVQFVTTAPETVAETVARDVSYRVVARRVAR